ncbi:MBL fold metallo-hydrolase [Bacillus massiliigorillae]|uniref:MBL fold metallo-hydrolase n=1 Tax=Bacillus massiliigorillae TaxID=1243664 RepID=UPI0003A31839|nr:MBL fold metallo-hydrolase [Bacillus massiliigorillae]
MLNKITDHVYQLQVPIPYDLGEVKCYIVEGENGYTIVDTGDNIEDAITLWKQVLPKDKKIEKVVLTHAHLDHIGLARWFQKNYNAAIWMSKAGYEEKKKIQSMFKGKKYNSPLSVLFRVNGGPEHPEEDEVHHRFDAYEFEPDYVFEEGEIIQIGDYNFETIWTPGHSPDHFSFYNHSHQILFVGDHILNSLNPIVMAQHMDENPLQLYLHALDKVQQYSTKYVLPGHGDLITNLSSRIEVMKSHYKKRWMQIHNALKEDGRTAFQISQSIYGTELPIERKMSAFLQTITNLIYLLSIDEIVMKKQKDFIYFYPKTSR